MLQVALYEPEIPPNTGNIARLCAATGCRLHLIGRLGFSLSDAHVKRAGLDYWPHVDLHRHVTFADFLNDVQPARLWLIENPAPRRHTDARFEANDVLLFGPESKGLPQSLREQYAEWLLQLPMFTPHVRSLNLSTAVGIAVYEALRQLHGW